MNSSRKMSAQPKKKKNRKSEPKKKITHKGEKLETRKITQDSSDTILQLLIKTTTHTPLLLKSTRVHFVMTGQSLGRQCSW
mmetsp:Transcript_65128/g.74856  ORF Transcript_65128/g.74856 Transcript_65128/m.74856 type:complete len:81 (-) Transcript_65128:644-886(-)